MSTETDTEPSTEPGWERVDVAPDVTFDLLSDSRRRTALWCLLERGGPMTVEDLASAIASDEADDAAAHHRRVEIALRHVHLPKLGDADVIEYRRATGVVALTAAIDDLAPLLERCVKQ